MWRWIFGPLRAIVGLFTAAASPRGLAVGCALGMMLGLLPKGNLTAAALSLVVLSLRVNLTAVAAATAVFSSVAVWTDPLAHRLGAAVLTQPAWQGTLAWLYELPLAPWTGLNNTVVLGSLLLSLVLFYPVYRVCWLVLHRHQARVAKKVDDYHLDKVLAAADAAVRWKTSQSS